MWFRRGVGVASSGFARMQRVRTCIRGGEDNVRHLRHPLEHVNGLLGDGEARGQSSGAEAGGEQVVLRPLALAHKGLQREALGVVVIPMGEAHQDGDVHVHTSPERFQW